MSVTRGLDHDMRKLRLERYTASAANEVKTWIEDALGEQLDGELLSALRDGVALCKLVNMALPPPGIKYKASNMPFTQRENISHFLTACETPPFNMPSHDRFLTVDLFDEKDPAQVIQCLSAFSRNAHFINPTRFPAVIGPKRGAPSPTRRTAEGSSYNTNTPSRPSRGLSNVSFGSPSSTGATKSPPGAPMMGASLTGGSSGARTPESLARSSGAISSWSRKADEGQTAPAWNIHQYGFMGGASQGNQGVVFGAPRQITSPSVNVPSTAEKQARMRQMNEEEEREATNRREAEQRFAAEKLAQIEASEERARIDEHRRFDEEAQKAHVRAREEAEMQRRALDKEREELRNARERELRDVERDKEERRNRDERRRAEEERARQEAEDVRRRSSYVSPPPSLKGNSELDRIKELEKQLAEAREREHQWRQRQQSASPPREGAIVSPDDSFAEGDEAVFANKPPALSTEKAPLRQPRPSDGDRPSTGTTSVEPKFSAGKPRHSPFARPAKTLEPAQAEIRPPAPLRATAEPPSGDNTDSSIYSSPGPPHVTRTDEYLSSNPPPRVSKPTAHVSEELGMSSTSERAAEDARRAASQQKTKAGGLASKSLLEKEMERERERQREWEENQIAKARAAGLNPRGIMGPRAMNSKAP